MKRVKKMIELKQATKPINNSYLRAKELKQQIKSLEMLLAIELETIKEYMGSAPVMVNLSGAEIVTYKESKPRIILNTEMLKTKYAPIYFECCEEKPGSRVLLLK